MWYLIMFVLGAIGASIAWFLIWRNNKEKFTSVLFDLDSFTNTIEKYNSVDEVKEYIQSLLNRYKK